MQFRNGNNFIGHTNLLHRGLSRVEAAAYAGLSPSAFSAARRESIYPNPTLPGGRYDRKLLDEAMDRLSGIGSNSSGSI